MKRKEQDLKMKKTPGGKIKRYNIKSNISPRNKKKKEQEQELQKQQQREEEKKKQRGVVEDEAREAERRMGDKRRATNEPNQVRKTSGRANFTRHPREEGIADECPTSEHDERNPTRRTGKRKEVVISETDGSERENEESDSGESAEEEQMQPGIIDIEKYEYQIGPQMRMRNALAEQRDILERPIHRKYEAPKQSR